MRKFKNLSFSEGINSSLADFKTQFEVLLVGLSPDEVKQAHKIATDGNINRGVGKRKETESIEVVADYVHSEDGGELDHGEQGATIPSE